MADRKLVLTERYGDELFECFLIRFETIRQKQGFNRRANASRHEYRYNGKIWPKSGWMALRSAAQAT